MANRSLAEAAQRAVTDDRFAADDPRGGADPGVLKPGKCSRFVRCVCLLVYGPTKYQNLFLSSAAKSAEAFVEAGLARPASQMAPLQVGDILFKTTGSHGFGHVGIYVGDGKVAENSTVHRGGPHGAKGYRTLAKYGGYDIVGRLPDPQAAAPRDAYSLVVGGKLVGELPLLDGQPYCRVTTWGDALGLDVDWSHQEPHLWIDGEPVPAEVDVQILEQRAYCPIADLARLAGLSLALDEAERTATVSRG